MNPECYYPWVIIESLFRAESNQTICSDVLGTLVLHPNVSFLFYILVFTLTCLFESLIYFPVARRQKLSHKKIIEQILILNLATHPIVFFLIPFVLEILSKDILTFVSVGESFAIIVEAILLKWRYRYSWPVAIMTSFAANALSWTLGVWLQRLNLL